MLVGVPVFRLPDLVGRCLHALRGAGADVLAIDNAADQDVKEVLKVFPEYVIISNQVNGYCNGAWNQILQYGIENNYDIIGLGSSDVTLHSGWYEKIVKRAEEFPNEVWIPCVGSPSEGVIYNPNTGWHFSFLPRKAAEIVFPIPSTIKHWFGDNHMHEALTKNGWRHVLLNEVSCDHEQSAITFRTPEAYAVIDQDAKEWEEIKRKK